MATTFKAYMANPACGVVKMTDTDDGSIAYLICGLPGGRPQFQFDLSSNLATNVANAPECDNLKALKAFAEQRFS